MLVRKRAKQSETAANYVKAVAQEDVACVVCDDTSDIASPIYGKAFTEAPKFQNGVGFDFDNGNGLWSSEQGFAVGGQERLSRLNGYLSEIAAAAFVCRVSLHNLMTSLVSNPLYCSAGQGLLRFPFFLIRYCTNWVAITKPVFRISKLRKKSDKTIMLLLFR